jgi:fructosamine-3-kinase
LSAWQRIAEEIATCTGSDFRPDPPVTLSGGCINAAFELSDGTQRWFVKTNRADRLDMFEAEGAGLEALAETQTLHVPRALCSGTSDGIAFLVIEHLALGRAGPTGWQQAGALLAEMHRHTERRFGWHRSNTIGSTAQHNDWHEDWITFWSKCRLGFQLETAARNGHGGRLQALGGQLLSRFAVLIDHAPEASLLHGDLWSGNLAFTQTGMPTIYDPASYYGDREAELAMTELFGGFPADFYAAYNDSYPLASGYRIRKSLYNLYHVLNHLNLFGGGYGAQAERMMQQLLAEC